MTAPIAISARGPLRGTARIPGDKSISHRALILAALAVGRSRIHGLCPGADVLATAAALEAMGARIAWAEKDACEVEGVGVGSLLQPRRPLDMGNSGTSARLLMGLIASHDIEAVLTGDASLSRRPMERVAAPLRRIGAEIATSAGTLPSRIRGIAPALPGSHSIAIPSAQVKSALLLAALNTPGITRIEERVATRDHSERLLRLFGAEIRVEANSIAITGEAELRPQLLAVPGDFSAAAFAIVAALIVPGSDIRIEAVGVNPRRTGLLHALQDMGGRIELSNERILSGEPVADLRVRHSPLRAVDLPPELAPDMIDEFPIFFIAAACAEGASRASGLAELRLKESDRIAAIAAGLEAIGLRVSVEDDALAVQGTGGRLFPGNARIAAQGDHRIAMAFAVAGIHAAEPIGIDDMTCAAISFPGFPALLDDLRR